MTANRRNDGRSDPPIRKDHGYKVDMLFSDFEVCGAAQKDEGEFGKKILRNGCRKMPKVLKDMLQNVVKRCPIKLCIVRTSEFLMTGTNCLVTIPLACIPYFFESYKFLYVVPNTRTFHPEIVMANQTVITYPSLYSLFEMRIVVRKLMRNPAV